MNGGGLRPAGCAVSAVSGLGPTVVRVSGAGCTGFTVGVEGGVTGGVTTGLAGALGVDVIRGV